MILGLLLGLLVGVAIGWILFRNERAYQDGWRDGERFGRVEGFKSALRKTSGRLLNPETGDWYET